MALDEPESRPFRDAIDAARPGRPRVEALGSSPAFLDAQDRIARAARTDRPVILIGERGTGKELAAARLHGMSRRWNQPYVTLDCASLAPTLIESELFGHEAGAFTGAIRRRKGRFELADGGTMFLDEAANIPLTAQEKILRVVEYGQVERVGGSAPLQVDARIVAATNVDLRQAAREGRFRPDLLDRLSFEVVTLPPLRARREDIVPLANHFARRMAAELELDFSPVLTEPARRALLAHDWPGNVRELKNVVERMVYRADGPELEEVVLDPFESDFAPESGSIVAAPAFESKASSASTAAVPGGRPEPARGKAIARDALDALPLPDAVRAYEIARIRDALAASRFNQRRAAERLGIGYDRFRGYYRKYRDELGGAGAEESKGAEEP